MNENQNELSPSNSRMSELGRLLENHGVNPQVYPLLERSGIKHLTPIQYFSVISGLFEEKNLLICASTSAGKTLIGELACINTILSKKKRCLYLVPLKSLANEKLKNFRKRWGGLGIQIEMSTGDMTLINREGEDQKLDKVDLLVTTYERADSILRSRPNWYSNLQVVVVDEIHSIGAAGRGARLEGFLTRLKTYFPQIQSIYLSATIGNPEELADWLNCELIKFDHRPVPLEYQIMVHPNRDEKIKEIVKETLQEQGSILIFASTRFEAEQLCSKISKYMKENELLYLVNGRELRTVAYQKREEIGQSFDQHLLYSIPQGIAFHHAGLSHVMREFIEDLFRKSLIKVITCTPTLSSGVNLPAKVVVIKDVGLTRNYLILESNMLHQMCGRAGRPGFDDWGRAIILATREGEKSEIEVIYFQSHSLIPRYSAVTSQFANQDYLLEQYLVWITEAPEGIKEAELSRLTMDTYWYKTIKESDPDTTVDHLIRVGHYSLENLLKRHSDPKTLRDARTIPAANVTIRRMDQYKLEGIVMDKMYIKCSFSREYPDCGCGMFDFKNRYRAKLCRHLVKLAQISFKKHPEYTKDMILAAVHEERLIDKLLKFKMVKIRNRWLLSTQFGIRTYLLYLRPQTAVWIRRRLPRIESKEQFYNDLMYAYRMERKFRAKAQMRQILERLFEDPYGDFTYHTEKIANEYQINPGDMEEFMEALRWMIHCFHIIADLDQVRAVLDFTISALDKLIPPQIQETNNQPEEISKK